MTPTPTTSSLRGPALVSTSAEAPSEALSDAEAGAADAAAVPATPAAPLFMRRVPSPIGRLEIISDGTHIPALSIERAGAAALDGAGPHA